MILWDCNTPRGRAIAAGSGAVLGGMLLAGFAWTHYGDPIFGAIAGAVLIGMLFHGVAAGTMSVITLWAVLFAIFFGMVGPGYDDFGGAAMIPAACVGAAVGGYLRWTHGGSSRPAKEKARRGLILDQDLDARGPGPS